MTVGSIEELENMLQAMELHEIKPIVDRVFSINNTKEAYKYLKSGKHFGKVCISHEI